MPDAGQRRRRARRRAARGVEHRAACGSRGCPPTRSRVARAVSVLGESAELPAVAALAGLDEPAVAAATGELARTEILRPDPPLGFVHPLVRDAVYHELPPGERALLHERAARLLRDAGAPAEQVAAQLLRGAAARRGVGRRRCCEAAGAHGDAPRRRRLAPSPTCAARSRSRRRRSGGPACCSSSAPPRR